jgi:hypothetical protein
MSLVEGWMPPTRERWELLLKIWQIAFPIVRLLFFSVLSSKLAPSPASPLEFEEANLFARR